MKISISKEQARHAMIQVHGIGMKKKYNLETIKTLIERLGCIQYDPLNVVGRNPDLVLQARVDGYTEDILDDLLYKERFLTDGWDKMMAIYPLEWWQHYARVRKSKDKECQAILKHRGSLDALEINDDVVEHIRLKGPTQSSELSIGNKQGGRWGHRKLSSASLDYLWNIGRLAVHHKNGVQKVYDLIENILPKELLEAEDPFSSDDAFLDWYVKRRIKGVGLLWRKNTSGWLGRYISKSKIRNKAIDRLLEQEEIVEVSIEGIDVPFYVLVDDLHLFTLQSYTAKVSLLGPLDNFMWDRDMIEALFDFKYRWEVYTPLKKREFGYYVLPMLYGTQFIGRIEFENYRGEATLLVKSIWIEEACIMTDEIQQEVHKALVEFCNYLGAKSYNTKGVRKMIQQQ